MKDLFMSIIRLTPMKLNSVLVFYKTKIREEKGQKFIHKWLSDEKNDKKFIVF